VVRVLARSGDKVLPSVGYKEITSSTAYSMWYLPLQLQFHNNPRSAC
jgi:hypothetical protein